MQNRITAFFVLFTFALSQSFASKCFAEAPAEKLITVGYYNLHNLFDADHSEEDVIDVETGEVVGKVEKNDYEFLPVNHPLKSRCSGGFKKQCEELDWTDEKYQVKLKTIKQSLDSVYPAGLPDILGVSEIENGRVVSDLAAILGYKGIAHFESPDERGIDVALLFNEQPGILTLAPADGHLKLNPQPVRIDSEGNRATRDIIRAVFNVGSKGNKLAIYGNHWPSQSNPLSYRMKAAETIVEDIVSLKGIDPQISVVVGGDLNLIEKDKPVEEFLLSESQNVVLTDTYLDLDSSDEGLKLKAQMPEGSYFYMREKIWNRLDRILINNNLKSGSCLTYAPNSFRFLASDLITRDRDIANKTYKSTPFYFNHKFNMRSLRYADYTPGFSDHLPVKVDLQLKADCL